MEATQGWLRGQMRCGRVRSCPVSSPAGTGRHGPFARCLCARLSTPAPVTRSYLLADRIALSPAAPGYCDTLVIPFANPFTKRTDRLDRRGGLRAAAEMAAKRMSNLLFSQPFKDQPLAAELR